MLQSSLNLQQKYENRLPIDYPFATHKLKVCNIFNFESYFDIRRLKN